LWGREYIVDRDMVSLHLSVKKRPVDSKQFGCFRFIVSGLFQGIANGFSFRPGMEGFEGGSTPAPVGPLLLMEIKGQITGPNPVSFQALEHPFKKVG
jgi:hypothetical protein